MISIKGAVCLTFVALFIDGFVPAFGIDWPEGYVVHEESESPDRQYGIIVPAAESDTGDNYLANLKTHQLLGKIEGADYFEHQNHRSLNVEWSTDPKWCVATYWDRYGFGSILILEPKDAKLTQTEIGDRVQKSLNDAMKKQSRDKEMAGDAGPYFRLGPGRKLRVRAISQNNPKQFDNVKTYYALFQGTFDLDAKKWTVTDARSIMSGQSDSLQMAYSDLDRDLEHVTYSTEQDKAESLDQKMNAVYQAAQFILPSTRFAAVKKEQVEWLKKRNAVPSLEEKCKMIVARIKALQDLVW
jgi:uncharacterized protein YecT (DUF1311 family)